MCYGSCLRNNNIEKGVMNGGKGKKDSSRLQRTGLWKDRKKRVGYYKVTVGI